MAELLLVGRSVKLGSPAGPSDRSAPLATHHVDELAPSASFIASSNQVLQHLHVERDPPRTTSAWRSPPQATSAAVSWSPRARHTSQLKQVTRQIPTSRQIYAAGTPSAPHFKNEHILDVRKLRGFQPFAPPSEETAQQKTLRNLVQLSGCATF